MDGTSVSLMERLRDETRELHTFAEQRPLQRMLGRGEAPKDVYVAYLAQLFHVHRRLETRLRAARDENVAIEALVEDDRMHEPQLRDDLAFFGVDPDAVDMTPATAAVVARIDELGDTHAEALVGMFYVLEGSTNGGRFIARVLGKAYDLAGDGLSYFDPYGDDQPDRWAEFKHRMNRIAWTDADCDAMVAAAEEMFRAIAAVSDSVVEA